MEMHNEHLRRVSGIASARNEHLKEKFENYSRNLEKR